MNSFHELSNNVVSQMTNLLNSAKETRANLQAQLQELEENIENEKSLRPDTVRYLSSSSGGFTQDDIL